MSKILPGPMKRYWGSKVNSHKQDIEAQLVIRLQKYPLNLDIPIQIL